MVLVLPKGRVFHEAENATGFAKGLGAIKFDLSRPHSSLAHAHRTKMACSTLMTSTSGSLAAPDGITEGDIERH
jgi:hypothetical protein